MYRVWARDKANGNENNWGYSEFKCPEKAAEYASNLSATFQIFITKGLVKITIVTTLTDIQEE